MPFSEAQTDKLVAKLNKAHVEKNPRGYDYIEGWRAIDEANHIFGFEGWDRETLDLKMLAEPELVSGNWRVAYMAKCRITVRTYTKGDVDGIVVREGIGYGSGIGKDIRDIHESAIKEAETDAMKRALMTFGNPFGLALYDKKKENVAAPEEAAPKATEKPASGRKADPAPKAAEKADKPPVTFSSGPANTEAQAYLDLCQTILTAKPWTGQELTAWWRDEQRNRDLHFPTKKADPLFQKLEAIVAEAGAAAKGRAAP